MSPAPRQRSRTTDVITARKTDHDETAFAGMDDALDLKSLKFDWVTATIPDLEVRGALTAITLERTIEGASTVEVALRDPGNRIFAESRMWEPKTKRDNTTRTKGRIGSPSQRGRALEIDFDGIVFRLVKVSKTHDELTLTFEDRVIAWLRDKRGTKRASRAKVTRAQFILSLLREVKSERVRFVCPDLNVRQPIDKPKPEGRALRAVPTTTGDTSSHGKSNRGVSPTQTLTVKGARATAEQRRIGERCLAVADRLAAGSTATLALMEALIVESEIRNLHHGHSSSIGVLQLLDLHGSKEKRLDVEWCVEKFLQTGFTGRGGAITIARKTPSMSAGRVAQAVQGSAFPARYEQVRDEATKWVNAYAGSGASVAESDAAGEKTRYKSYQFSREDDEDSWTSMQRLASEVGWRCFLMGHSVYYMNEEDLFRRKPLYALTPDDDWVLSFDYDIDWGKSVSEARVTINAGRWKVPPGEPVIVEGYGPPDGRWLVTAWRRDYFSPTAEITLKQPARAKLEPAPEKAPEGSRSEGDGLIRGGLGDVPTAIRKAYNRVTAIDAKKQAYKWGGGHGSFNDPAGYDCSGFVSSVLHAAGLLDGSPMSTAGFAKWGEPGLGKYLTVWVRETGNPRTSHVFIVFTIRGQLRYAEAGGSESGRTGWHGSRTRTGFKSRNHPGT